MFHNNDEHNNIICLIIIMIIVSKGKGQDPRGHRYPGPPTRYFRLPPKTVEAPEPGSIRKSRPPLSERSPRAARPAAQCCAVTSVRVSPGCWRMLRVPRVV